MLRNNYQTLGLNTDASKEEIKEAYRKYVMKLHPDKHAGDEFFADRFREVKEAYEGLMNNKTYSVKEETPEPTKKVKIKNKHFTITKKTEVWLESKKSNTQRFASVVLIIFGLITFQYLGFVWVLFGLEYLFSGPYELNVGSKTVKDRKWRLVSIKRKIKKEINKL